LFQALLNPPLDAFTDADPLDAGDVGHVLHRFESLKLGPSFPIKPMIFGLPVAAALQISRRSAFSKCSNLHLR
jgi:hypothetical protein